MTVQFSLLLLWGASSNQVACDWLVNGRLILEPVSHLLVILEVSKTFECNIVEYYFWLHYRIASSPNSSDQLENGTLYAEIGSVDWKLRAREIAMHAGGLN